MEELEYNPLLCDEEEEPTEIGMPIIKQEAIQPAFTHPSTPAATAEKRNRTTKNRKKVEATPIATPPSFPISVQSSPSWPETNPSRYTPPQTLPDPNIFTMEVIPVDDQKKEEEIPFIHLRLPPPKSGDAITISQKLEEKLTQMENQNASSRRFLRETVNGIPDTKVFQPMYVSPYSFPSITKYLEIEYEDILQIMKIPHYNFKRDKIQVVSRTYEVDFCRQPVGSERQCANDGHCVATQIPSAKDKKITLREYYLPDHYKICKERGCWPDDRQECVLCMFYAIAKKYYNVKGDQTGIEGDASISSFVHLVGVPGEYCIENCIGPTEKRFMGLWGPVYLFKLTDWDLRRRKVTHMSNGKPTETEVWGFDLNAPVPPPDGSSLFFHQGSLVPKISEKFARLSISRAKESGTTH